MKDQVKEAAQSHRKHFVLSPGSSPEDVRQEPRASWSRQENGLQSQLRSSGGWGRREERTRSDGRAGLGEKGGREGGAGRSDFSTRCSEHRAEDP